MMIMVKTMAMFLIGFSSQRARASQSAGILYTQHHLPHDDHGSDNVNGDDFDGDNLHYSSSSMTFK